MAKVTVGLYNFLKERECGIQFVNNCEHLDAWVEMFGIELDDLIKAGGSYFDEVSEYFVVSSGSLIFTDLVGLIQYNGDNIEDYRDCFDNDDLFDSAEFKKWRDDLDYDFL